MFCCFGCAICAVTIRPDADIEDDEDELELPGAVGKRGAQVVDLAQHNNFENSASNPNYNPYAIN